MSVSLTKTDGPVSVETTHFPLRDKVTARLEFDGESIYCYPSTEESFKVSVGHLAAATRVAIFEGSLLVMVSTVPTEFEEAKHFKVSAISAEVILWECHSPVVL